MRSPLEDETEGPGGMMEGYARAAAGAPDPTTDPKGAEEAARQFDAYALSITSIFWVPAGIIFGGSIAYGLLEGLRQWIEFAQGRANSGSVFWQLAIPVAALGLGFVGFAMRNIVRWKRFGWCEIGVGMGVASHGFMETPNQWGALFALLAGVMIIIDALTRLSGEEGSAV